MAAFPGAAFGVTDADDIAWLERRMVPQPLRTLTEPVRLTSGAVDALAKTFVDCTEPALNPDSVSAQRAQSEPNWNYIALATGHDAMLTEPRALADILLGVL